MAKERTVKMSSLVEKTVGARGGALYTLFADPDTADDPFTCRETAAEARSCLAVNIAALAEACASAVSGDVGLSHETTAKCFYGISQMCKFLEAITDVHDDATYQCMKQHENQRPSA